MANRFGEQYRPPHSGASVFGDMYGRNGDDKYPNNPQGGADIYSKPKPKKPSSSGGIALSLPAKEKEKVGLW
jgi:hypothetical protein